MSTPYIISADPKSQQPLKAFASLFRGRGDAWGQFPRYCKHELVTLAHYQRHLKGEVSLGIYPLRDDGTCSWGTTDLDQPGTAPWHNGPDDSIPALTGSRCHNEEVKQMRRGLSNYEQETIINFNKAEDIAPIFTYGKVWQQHLKKRLGLKPTMDNGFGGKGYEIDKRRIRPPRAPVRLSAEARAKLTKRMKDMSQKRSLRSKTTVAAVKSDKKKQSKDKTITTS